MQKFVEGFRNGWSDVRIPMVAPIWIGGLAGVAFALLWLTS